MNGVQPLRVENQVKSVYLFKDEEMRHEMENYHIRKTDQHGTAGQQHGIEAADEIRKAVENTMSESGNSLMYNPITNYEVELTFGKGSDTPGPDGISAALINKANRDWMRKCLSWLWNIAWTEGLFVDVVVVVVVVVVVRRAYTRRHNYKEGSRH